jgi:hypothetical protein
MYEKEQGLQLQRKIGKKDRVTVLRASDFTFEVTSSFDGGGEEDNHNHNFESELCSYNSVQWAQEIRISK